MNSNCKEMDSEIIDFIKKNNIAAFCCSDTNNKPYCFHSFYAFDAINYLLFFKSSSQTFHSKMLSQNPYIAGSILPGKIEILALKGIQLTGIILSTINTDWMNPTTYYHKKFPFALAKPGDVWCIQLAEIKMTDNSHVFGKKYIWKRNTPALAEHAV
jgi:uncharacterized protein YhbP (UPF0306 family)